MSYIGNSPFTAAFLTDTFSGNGSTTAFTLSAAPANTSSILVAISGVLQDPSTYSVSGTTLTFSPAPPSGTGNISVRFLGIPASGVTTTAYRTVTEFTATAGQTTFSVPSYTPGFIDVYRNGVMLGSADYTATNGLTVVLAIGATSGDLIEVISFQVSSVLNAIPASPASVGTSNIANGVTINFADGSASAPSITNDGDSNTGMFFPAADTIAFAEGGVESMRIDSSGNVGIGVTPTGASGFLANKLLEMGGASAPALVFRPTGSTCEHTVLGAGDGLVLGATGAATASNNAIRFFTSNTNSSTTPTERMRIDSSGNLLVGTTATTPNPGFSIYPSGGFSAGNSAGGSGFEFATFRRSGTQIGSITQNGTTAVAYNTSSDYRLKENITPMTGALGVVQQLKPVTYTWKVDGSEGQGFIAHELQAVVPDCVTGEKDAVDAEGNPIYQGIDTSFLVATLTAAIQEQQQIIEDLKARIEVLEAK